MITPRFKLSQNESTITINIRAPYCDLKESEVSIEDDVFIFCASPYYLRLHFPGRLVDENLNTSFDADSGEFTFITQKAIDGEHFPDLNLITKLLTPKVSVTDCENSRSIDIICNGDETIDPGDLNEEFGFALCGKKNFQHVAAEFRDVFEIDPREVKLDERHKMRLQFEQGKFDMCHYLCDLIENEEILEKIALESPWKNQKSEITFSDNELDFLKDLPNKKLVLSEIQINYAYCGLIEILFAYCYDCRITDFENCSESGWTITKIAATFSWLDVFKNFKETLVCAFRRSLTYPLFRSFQLCETILLDLKQLLKLGRIQIIKSLINIYNIFLKGDCCRYILNNLFINDYIMFIMNSNEKRIEEVLAELETISINKNDLGFNLEQFENEATEELNKFTQLKIKEDSDDSDDSDSSSDSSNSDVINKKFSILSINK